MEIAGFESAMRAILGERSAPALLATPEAGLRFDRQMQREFQDAARTLAARTATPGKENILLRAAAQWA